MPTFFGMFSKNFFQAVVFYARAWYNVVMDMRKITIAALSLCLLFGAGGFAASEKASAAEEASLFLPTTYEQYLPLSNPSDVAVNDDYIAIADGNLVYVYDREGGGNYRVYTHLPGSVTPITVSKLQFSEAGRLYLADSAQQLYELNLTTLTVGDPLVALSTFCIADGYLYAVTVSSSAGAMVYQLNMSRPLSISDAEHFQPLSTSPSTPCMTYGNGKLYCALSGTVYVYGGESLEAFPNFSLDTSLGFRLETSSLCAADGGFYYTDQRGLQRTDETGSSEIVSEGAGFGALTSHAGKLYCVKGSSVREYDLTQRKYTGYEIAAASDSENRLSGATETVRAGDLIVTADGGNNRISIYNEKTAEFTLLSCDGTPTCVATDGEIIAAGVGNRVLLYHYGDPSPYRTQTSESEIAGVAVVFGKCYYVTAHSYGVAEEGSRDFPRSDSPIALSNDVYGNLYVADLQGGVTKFTEAEFLDYRENGTAVTTEWSLPATARSLRCDYDGNVYYLYNNAIYRNGGLFMAARGADLVYHSGAAPALVSFALSFEDNTLYLQYGDFVVRTETEFPSLSTIAAADRDELFTAPEASELSFVDVAPSSTGIRVDLGKLEKGDDYYAYLSYGRTEGGRGALLRADDKFSLVALYEDYGYTVALFPNGNCTPAEAEVTAESGIRYTTNEIAFSYYPALDPSLTIKRLARSSEVKFLSSVSLGGYGFDYAYVEADGVRGYLPLHYLSENAAIPPEANVYYLGYLKANKDGIVFYRSDDRSQTITVTERTQVMIYDTKDGLFRVELEREGAVYATQVTRDKLEVGNPNALRTSLIVVLCVIAVVMLMGYVIFVPKRKKAK